MSEAFAVGGYFWVEINCFGWKVTQNDYLYVLYLPLRGACFNFNKQAVWLSFCFLISLIVVFKAGITTAI